MADTDSNRLRAWRGLPRDVLMLGLVSLFMDTSSELIHSLLPVFLVSTLGASMVSLGVIEGIAEATALVVKVFSGTLSDVLGKRKLLAVAGYGLATLSKPLFPLADSVPTVLLARFVDRIGKGIRGAPRDALIADVVQPEQRGAAFGLRQSLDTVGAVAGPAIAIGAMFYFADRIRTVFWIAIIPAVIAVAILVAFVREPKQHRSGDRAKRLRLSDLYRLGTAFWGVAAIGGVLTLARFSEAFLVIRASSIGLGIALVPLVLIVMNVTYTLAAYPAGAWSDRIGRRTVLMMGIGFLAASDAVLATAGSIWIVLVGVVLWGLHLGFTQGLLVAMVADAAPESIRGTALGIFNLISGVVMLGASVLAGLLWDHYGPAGTFGAGGVLAVLALVGFAAVGAWRRTAA